MSGDRDQWKRAAAEAAVAEVTDGVVVGLGSGSTAAWAIRALGERVENGLDIVGVATSAGAATVAREAGVPVRQPADVAGIDVAIDGADQVAGSSLIKGGGGAHTREKVIDTAADRFHVVVDETKLADSLDLAVPVASLPDTTPLVAAALRDVGGTPSLRTAGDQPVTTENGNRLIDVDFGTISDPAALATILDGMPGVLSHGLFIDCADGCYIGGPDGVTYENC